MATRNQSNRAPRDAQASQETSQPNAEAQQLLRAGIASVVSADAAPKVVLLSVKEQEAADDLAKDLKSSDDFKLDAADIKYCAGVAKKASTELNREGGFHDLSGKLAASRSTLTDIQYEIAMRAERAVRVEDKSVELGYQHGVLGSFLAYYDKMFTEVETVERKLERDRRPKDGDVTKLAATKELFGAHWISSRSAMRRSIRAGLRPSDFKNGTSFINASKVRKERKNGTDKGKAAPTTPAVDVTATLPISMASLPRLIEALKKVDIDADMQAAEILMHAAKALASLAAGTFAPAEGATGTEG